MVLSLPLTNHDRELVSVLEDKSRALGLNQRPLNLWSVTLPCSTNFVDIKLVHFVLKAIWILSLGPKQFFCFIFMCIWVKNPCLQKLVVSKGINFLIAFSCAIRHLKILYDTSACFQFNTCFIMGSKVRKCLDQPLRTSGTWGAISHVKGFANQVWHPPHNLQHNSVNSSRILIITYLLVFHLLSTEAPLLEYLV